MAIIVEEERSRVNIVRLLGWIAVLAIIGIAVYYIFFVTPELVILPQPSSLNTINPLGSIANSVNPEGVLNSPAYTSLKSPPVELPKPNVAAGRTNPFVPPQ